MNNKKFKKILALFVLLFVFYTIISGAFSIYRETQGDSINLNILNPSGTVAVTFNPNGGTIPSADATRNVPIGTAVGPLPTSMTRTDYNFDGWYTDPQDGQGVKITKDTIVTGTTVTYYAHWIKIVCKKALTGTLHTETCSTGGSCLNAMMGYSLNDTITYGTIPGAFSPLAGDAYDCDVNDDGIWDPLTERFYYMRSFGGTSQTENSSLIHFTSFDENGQMDSGKSRGSHDYDTALTLLPTATTWDNPALIENNGNVTRFIQREDIIAACGGLNDANLANCQFILETSRFQSSELGRAGIWIEKENSSHHRIHTQSLYIYNSVSATSDNTARPVIDIPSNTIEDYVVAQPYTVTFDPGDGDLDDPTEASREVQGGTAIGTLPTATYAHHTFLGWFTDPINGTEITAQTVVSGNDTYYAHWVENITITFNANGGTVTPASKEIAPGDAIGELPVPMYNGREFAGWYTDPDDGTAVHANTTFNTTTQIYAHWEKMPLQYVFYIPGECTFTSTGITNGPNENCISTVNPTGSNIDYTQSSLSTKKYIDTGIALYDTTNHDKDYEIHFEIVSYDGSENESQATFFNTKNEGNNFPGLVVRRTTNNANQIEFASRKTSGANESVILNVNTITKMSVYRINGEIYYSLNDGEKVFVNDLTQFNPVFDLTTWFGGAPNNASATAARRFLTGTLKNIYIKLTPNTPTTATITFDPNYQGSQTFDEEYTLGQPIGELPTTTRTGYTFLGWFDDPTSGTQITSNTVVNEDDTFYAHWHENVTITLHPNGGTVTPNTITVEYNNAIGELPTPTKANNTFDGWYQDQELTIPVTSQTALTADADFYAKWVPDVTVTLNANGGTVTPNTITVGQGQAVGTLPTPTKAGNTFDGWYQDQELTIPATSETIINNDTVFYAKWIPDVTVTLNANGGTVSPNTITVQQGQAVGTLPTPTKTGNTFAGWYQDQELTTPATSETIINNDTVFYAKWIEDITVTFNAKGGTVSPSSVTFQQGTAIGQLPTPEKIGYDFDGWYTDDETYLNEVTASTVFNTTTEIYAKWEESADITVTFDADGGTVTPSSKTFAPETAIGELPTPEKTDYVFVGWYTDNTWTTEVTADTTFNSSTTILAKWVDETYVACIGSTCYTTLQNAVDDVPTTGEKTTIKIIQDITTTTTTTIPATKWVELNIGTHTISSSTNGIDMFTNNGKLDIINGTIIRTGASASKKGYIFKNNAGAVLNISGGSITYNRSSDTEAKPIESTGTVNITGGELSCNAQAAVINANAGILNVSGGRLIGSNTAKGQAIYNNGATTTISGTAYLENNSNSGTQSGRSALTNNAGQVYILGGTIISKNNAAVKNNGSMTIGDNTDGIDTTSPVLQGSTYGLETVSGKTVYIYDGIFKGKTSTNDKAISNESYVNTGTYNIVHDSETIEGVQYTVAYLQDAATCTITLNPGQDGTVSPASKTFTSGTAIGLLPTPQRAGYNFNGWYTETSGGTEVTAETVFSNDDTIYAHWVENITINFSVNGGDTVEYNSKTLTTAGPIGSLPTASKASTEFLGWFSSASGGERLLTTTEMTASDNGKTYYAHYTNATTVCRPATTLHTDGSTTFGQIHSGSSLSAGDAYDCDVNGDGTFDATNERFYYLTNSSDGKAVFIFSNNIHQSEGSAVAMCKPDAIAYASDFTQGPNTAITELPTTTEWSNVNLYTEPRTITNESGTTIVNNYLYTEKAARFATVDEIKAATTSSINGTTNELASYTFLLENTKTYGDCRSNYWLETTNSSSGAYRIDGDPANKKLGHATGSSGVRPVIEVPYNSIDGVDNIVEFDTIPAAMRVYFNNVSTWNAGQDDTNYTSFNNSMTANLNNYDCAYYQNDNVGTQYGSVFCDQPNKYDTGITGNVNVYEYNESTGVTSQNQATYVSNDNGKLYNFIPGKTYYWVSATDSTKNGYVRPTGERRLITIPGTTRQTRNVRDLGGLPVDTNGDGTIDGTTKFAKIYRGEKIWGTNRNGVTRAQFEKLGIYNELDLRTQGSEIVASEEDQLSTYIPNEIVHYKIDYDEFGVNTTEFVNGKTLYDAARDAAIDVMQRVVAANDDYAIFFHCRIGADRTGTLAYLLEGVLGVPTEYRHQDYELTTFFGLRERTRYYYNKSSNYYKFLYLKKAIRHATPNNDEIYGEENVMDWFLLGGNSTNDCNDITALINQFRAKMIDYN